jgi:acyl-CoA dehydrogenase
MQTIAQSGAGFSGASAIHMNIFGLNPLVVFGTAAQKKTYLPPLIRGENKACFAVTEPNVGLDTTKLKVRAERNGDRYIVSGQKIWISTAQVASHVLLLARTTPLDAVKSPTEGLSLFYTPLDRKFVEVREIDKMGRAAVDSNQVFFDNLPVPVADRIGEEGKGFQYILHGMNPERILIAAEAVGLGRAALARAATYARERVVFGRPIGQNQGIQHPLAKCWAELEAANLMAFKAATLYDAGQPCGVEANAAKYLAAEACFHACETAVMSHGISRRAVSARELRGAHYSGVARTGALLHRGASAGNAEIVLSKAAGRPVKRIAPGMMRSRARHCQLIGAVLISRGHP